MRRAVLYGSQPNVADYCKSLVSVVPGIHHHARAPKNIGNMLVPKVERLALFCFPIMPLVYSSDPGARAAHMVEDGFRNLEANPEPLKARRKGSAKVVQSPRCNRIATILCNEPV